MRLNPSARNRMERIAYGGHIVVAGALRHERRHIVTISVANLQPIVALVAGVLILVMPRLLNYIVALYLIVVGILGLGILK